METSGNFLTKQRLWLGLVCLLATGILAAGIAWRTGVDFASLKTGWTKLLAWLLEHPSAIFLAIVILPGLPVPMSALLFTTGVVWRAHPVVACLLCLLAMALNLCWTYWLSAGPAHKLVAKLLAVGSLKMPELPRENHLRMVLVLKLTPGIPFFAQNYICGFLRVPFHLYLPISILCNGVVGIGFVLSGVGLGDGKVVPALTGISLIALAAVMTHWIRAWLAKKKRVVEQVV